ncbi:hypothetical protein REPUB_Repub02eG0031400 [Reevesia pubescens]
MAKIALVVVFSLVLVLSIQSVVGEFAFSEKQINETTSKFKKAAEETTSSWGGWAKKKLRNFGLLSTMESVSAASSPDNAPSPAPGRSFGPEPAGAPMV